jgi:Zn-dependent peptidase ImmA (M78 family)
MAGYSLQDLSDKMLGKVSRIALHRYEKGEMKPTTENLIALSNALEVKPDYFFRGEPLEIEKIEFRKKTALSKKEEYSIIEKSKDFIQRYLELEGLLDIESEFFNPVSKIKINSFEDVDEAVVQLREAWDLGMDPIPNVVEMLEENAVKVYMFETDENFDGISGWAKNIPVIVLNAARPVDRIRFSSLHELGHLILEFTDKIKSKKKFIESLCNRFANSMLIPTEIFKSIFGNSRSKISMRELLYIKRLFGISIRAIMYKAKELMIITENTYKWFLINLNKKEGSNKSEPGNFNGDEKAYRFFYLIEKCLNEGIITIAKAAVLADKPVSYFRESYKLNEG